MKVCPVSIKALDRKRSMNVEEVHSVLNQQRPVIWSWGARSWTQVPNKALMFRVSGSKFKGNVMISLNFMDLFHVEFFNIRGAKKHEIDDVFVGDLVNIIDEHVEKQSHYAF
jgi:hypothetical protein